MHIYIYIYKKAVYKNKKPVCVYVLHKDKKKQKAQSLFSELSYSFNTSRYTNADLKISQYVLIHMQIIF